jgi:hypothetical protein
LCSGNRTTVWYADENRYDTGKQNNRGSRYAVLESERDKSSSLGQVRSTIFAVTNASKNAKPYRLKIETPATDPVRRMAVWIPAGETIQISTFRPNHRRMVEILGNGQTLLTFVADIERWREEVSE